jgi:hypothetical protein
MRAAEYFLESWRADVTPYNRNSSSRAWGVVG